MIPRPSCTIFSVGQTEQSPREQQLAVVIYNVCFLVLGGVPPIARRPWDLYYRSKNLARLQDSGKCNY